MHLQKKYLWLVLIAILITASSIFSLPSQAQTSHLPLFILSGSGNSNLESDFFQPVLERAQEGLAKILVLPISLSEDPLVISASERENYIEIAERQRIEIEQACKQAVASSANCQVILAPMLVRTDAMQPANLDYFSEDLAAIIILDGEPTTAMQVIGGTPIELEISRAYERGVIVASTGQSINMFSLAMYGGYSPHFDAGNPLNFGAVDVWNSFEHRGLIFGLTNVILDQKPFSSGHFSRLLNSITLPDSPHTGITIESDTSASFWAGKQILQVFGKNTIAILDANTYHSADRVQYRGNKNVLSLRNILIHLVPPGDFSYDLESNRFISFAGSTKDLQPATLQKRAFEFFPLPSGVGSLILSGDMGSDIAEHPALKRFLELSNAAPDKILVHLNGFDSDDSVQRTVAMLASAFGDTPQVVIAGTSTPNPTSYEAVILLVAEQAKLDLADLQAWLVPAWKSGKPILAEGEIAEIFGQYFFDSSVTSQDADLLNSGLPDHSLPSPGLGLINALLIPDATPDNLWNRLFSIAYAHPELVAIGINAATGLEITSSGASVIGDSPVVMLDLRTAQLARGTNQANAIANGLLDVFAPGEEVIAEEASITASFTTASTPDLITPTETLTPTATPLPTKTPEPPKATPTRHPRPTPTPLIIPPPSDRDATNLMVLFGVSIIVVVIFGIWLNRSRLI